MNHESRMKKESRVENGTFRESYRGLRRDSLFLIRDSSQKGFALLFAILASSVLLSIGAAIWNIAFREVLLSSFGRESQTAFYVADSAIECAFYHDFIGTDVFSTSTDSISPSFWDNYRSINCGGSIINVGIYHPSGLYQIDSRNATSTFTMNVGSGKAIVVIGKSDPDGDGRSATNIVSHGQNSLNPSDPTIVERGLRASY
ncbi:MAG: pilus assembly PilX N-terminal domain-containing protein [bacterium]|nr:pilus assembly PilX N-terminal domain-containing protein [bacterium]